ncbi:MAG: hypothetical protein EBV45_02120 [Chloroflexi bacterium]|nr:hypothetical protein [Chloroflexota bacterium]
MLVGSVLELVRRLDAVDLGPALVALVARHAFPSSASVRDRRAYLETGIDRRDQGCLPDVWRAKHPSFVQAPAYRVAVAWPKRSASESGGAGVGLIGISTPSGAGGGGMLHAGKVAIFMTWYAAPGTSQTVPATVARTCRIQGTTQEPAR